MCLIVRLGYRNAPNNGVEVPSCFCFWELGTIMPLVAGPRHHTDSPSRLPTTVAPPSTAPPHTLPSAALTLLIAAHALTPPPSTNMGGPRGRSKWWGEGITHLPLPPVPAAGGSEPPEPPVRGLRGLPAAGGLRPLRLLPGQAQVRGPEPQAPEVPLEAVPALRRGGWPSPPSNPESPPGHPPAVPSLHFPAVPWGN